MIIIFVAAIIIMQLSPFLTAVEVNYLNSRLTPASVRLSYYLAGMHTALSHLSDQLQGI